MGSQKVKGYRQSIYIGRVNPSYDRLKMGGKEIFRNFLFLAFKTTGFKKTEGVCFKNHFFFVNYFDLAEVVVSQRTWIGKIIFQGLVKV